MRASIGLAILKGNLNLGEIAKQFNVTPERVTQIVKDVKTTKFGEIAISRMSNLSFTYQAAYNAFIRDIEQLDGIGERLVASARGVRGDRITNIAKLGKLKTIEVQIDKLPQAYQDARNKFDAAIDAADSAYVDKVKGLCSYAASTGQGCAGMHYPLEECKAYDRAKGDFKLRRALHAGLVDLTASVADASEKRSPSSEPEILGRLEAISDPEEATAFYNKHQQEILAAFEARKFNNS